MQVLSNQQTFTAVSTGQWTSNKWGSSSLGGGGNRTFQFGQTGGGAVTVQLQVSNDGVNVAKTAYSTTALTGAGLQDSFVLTEQWAFFRYNVTAFTATSVTMSAYGA